VYSDGSAHCWSCGHHVHAKRRVIEERKEHGDESKAVLPRDFTREVPAAGWKWLLQYGLPYSYWRPFVGYSPGEERLVITFGTPVRFSIGRYLGNDPGEKDGRGRWLRRPPRKWYFYGEGHQYVELLDAGCERRDSGPIVLVEDIVSAHKVAHAATALCLFGTNVHDLAVKTLVAAKRPVVIWLDDDQRQEIPKKVGRLQTFLKHPVKAVFTDKDPKEYSLEEIKELLK
jgi:hypothetical protein